MRFMKNLIIKKADIRPFSFSMNGIFTTNPVFFEPDFEGTSSGVGEV